MNGRAKLLRTSTFRLAALYLILFAASVGALLGYVYLNTAVLLQEQTDYTIQAEVQALSDQYQLRGLGGILDTVRRRSADEKGSVYLLAAPTGLRIAGNLDDLPTVPRNGARWIEFPLQVQKGAVRENHVARAFYTDLPGGFKLIVGRDVESLRQFANIIRQSIFYALAIALVLGLGGGLLMSRNFLRRVDAITDASRSIMAGNMSGRMPVSGSNDELDRLALALNEMLDRIESLMGAMKEVSSNVAHDLKTPLTRIKARVEAALRSGSEAEYRAALENTVDDSDRLLDTFNALLSIARAEAGQARSGLVPVDVSELIADVAELYEPMAEQEGGTLTASAAPGLQVLGDRQLLAQALSNLLDNALKYGARDGGTPRIALTGAAGDGKVVIAVADHGEGIPEADRTRVTERFVRLDRSRTKPGNGLGLSLVSGVMKLHKGTLLLEDNAPGLRAKLVLPAGR
ncbi:HAMP domain-containing sensor histidine kinase [Aestuariivirga sp.]|uniref:HAMP domain-containing sensor histidine kinase n=1 Tax=Aestuariivirga sp. TaxID=2650926 RepID=UPI0025C6A21F|nr:HAMP domain-containing sensor histidine kinase [Aestuariivirga sp.]MCA3555333.1 HAMP domain-containing histidine kinase [Aestuariivirga sp.]